MEKPADLIKDAFEQKTWHEIHTTDSWRVFKIISELVEGFEKLARIGPCVSIFGSARTHLKVNIIFLLKRLLSNLHRMDMEL